jgi:hypothetical protein
MKPNSQYSFYFAIFFVIAVLVSTSASQTDTTSRAWKLQIETSLGVTQSAYSDNWTGGEAGSIIWASGFHGTANRQLSRSWFFGNELTLAFGQTHSQNKDTKRWAVPEKSSDKIRYDGIVRLTRGWVVDPYVAGTFESQFLDASGMKKRYVNPMDLTETAGMARVLMNVPDIRFLSVRLGAGARENIARMDDPIVPNHTLSKTTTYGGAEFVTALALGSAKTKYSFNSNLTLFQAVFNSEADKLKGQPNADYWKTVDVNWDNILRVDVTALLQVSLAWQLLYDKEISLGGRFKETLALGLAYRYAYP